MEAGRKRNQETHMKGCINQENNLTDMYLPRKCDYTDKLITPQDKSSVQLTICDVGADGRIIHDKSNIITISGFVRYSGQSDKAIEKVMKEKRMI